MTGFGKRPKVLRVSTFGFAVIANLLLASCCTTNQNIDFTSKFLSKYDIKVNRYLFEIVQGKAQVINEAAQVWESSPDRSDLADIYPDTFPQEIQAVLRCRVSKGRAMEGCEVTDLDPKGNRYKEMILKLAPAFKLYSEILQDRSADKLEVAIAVRVRNANGQATQSRPCLPPFCQITPPPPKNPPAAGG